MWYFHIAVRNSGFQNNRKAISRKATLRNREKLYNYCIFNEVHLTYPLQVFQII